MSSIMFIAALVPIAAVFIFLVVMQLSAKVAMLFAYLATDPVADLLGIVFEDIRPGYARARMPVTHRLLNAPGTAHGGAMMALIDVVHAAVSNSHGTLAVAQDVHTEFLSAGVEDDVLRCFELEMLPIGRCRSVGHESDWRWGVPERRIPGNVRRRIFPAQLPSPRSVPR